MRRKVTDKIILNTSRDSKCQLRERRPLGLRDFHDNQCLYELTHPLTYAQSTYTHCVHTNLTSIVWEVALPKRPTE
jgi:hypothetical protein